jgi:bifunctional non-homologous end joining protein LigD
MILIGKPKAETNFCIIFSSALLFIGLIFLNKHYTTFAFISLGLILLALKFIAKVASYYKALLKIEIKIGHIKNDHIFTLGGKDYQESSVVSIIEVHDQYGNGLSQGHNENGQFNSKMAKDFTDLFETEVVNKIDKELNLEPQTWKKTETVTASEIDNRLKSGHKSAMPTSISPMLCTLIKEPFNNEAWIYEVKWDGYRIIAFVKNGKVTLKSRGNQDYTK